MKRLLTAAALVVLSAAPGLARQNWAILVGAMQYDSLDQKYWLKGPGNDMQLVYGYLMHNPSIGFDADHIILLADGIDGAQRPTLAAIRAAFAEIAAKAEDGDFVYVHFAGHGSQAPAADPSSELDGLDELFLPVDIGPWEDAVSHVQNALVDDEIGQMIDAIRLKGADVWAVFDSCHSGTVTRGAPDGDDEVMERQLPPEALGIPDKALVAAEEEAQTASRGMPPADPRDQPKAPVDVVDEPGMGSFVGFYAAQTNETTPEKRLPKGDPDRKAQGVFTFTIFQTLAEHPGLTYRQLAEEVLRKYAVFNLTRTTPMFEGDLDGRVFDTGEAGLIQQWPAQVGAAGVKLDAGKLHGIAPGERLAVLASPADPVEAALGYVVASKVDTFATEAVAEGDLKLAEIPKGAVVRKIESAVDYTLTIALPEGDSDPAKAMQAAAALLAADEEMGKRIRFVAPGEEADLRLAILPESPRPDAIWLLPATGLVEIPEGETLADALRGVPSVSTADKDTAALAEALGADFTHMARAINLMKLGSATGTGGLAVKAELRRAVYDGIEPDLIVDGSRKPIDGANVPRMVPDDVVGVRLENTTDGPVDYNVLYVGEDYSITWMGNGRMNQGEVLDEDFVLITDENFGRDRLIVVLTPARAGTSTEDLSFLAQEEVTLTRGNMSDIEGALREAGFGETTRGAVALRKKDPGDSRQPVILQYDIETVRK